MLDLFLRSHDLLHKGYYFLCEQDVVVSDEGDFVFHSIDDSIDELGLLEKCPCVPHYLLEMVFFAPAKLTTVKFAFEKNDS